MVDFGKLLAEEREPDLVITFEVTRGSFTVPAEVMSAATEGDDWGLRRLFAIHLPDRHEGSVLSTSRQAHKDGSATITWRCIVTHVSPA